MAHHLRYFRFSNRTQIEMNEDLSMEDFFKEDDIEDTLRLPGRPKKSRNSEESKEMVPQRKKAQTPE